MRRTRILSCLIFIFNPAARPCQYPVGEVCQQRIWYIASLSINCRCCEIFVGRRRQEKIKGLGVVPYRRSAHLAWLRDVQGTRWRIVIFRYIRIVSPSHWLLGIHTRKLLRLVKSVTGNRQYERIFIEIEKIRLSRPTMAQKGKKMEKTHFYFFSTNVWKLLNFIRWISTDHKNRFW